MPAWVWYCIRARSLWFFTPSNPTLTFGGFDGESKREMYEQLPPGSYPKTIFITYPTPFSSVESLLNANHLTFPVAVKPDVGRMGLMFRKLDSLADLQYYHEKMKADYVVQEFVPYPIEVSVFYYRFPDQHRGTITGFVRKDYLAVTGDGNSTLWQLITAYPRVRFRLEEMKLKHEENLSKIIPSGETYILSHALNLSRGGKLVSLEHEKDGRLLEFFDALSHYSGRFYFGRYDIKCGSIEDLKNGTNYSILEFNGSGAEPHHVYGTGNSLFQALKILVDHWNILFKISMTNRKKGIRPWTFKSGFDHLMKTKNHFALLRRLEFESSLTPEKVSNEIYLKPDIQVLPNSLRRYGAASQIRSNRNAD